jgi:xanthine dehydrogenase accessory factor
MAESIENLLDRAAGLLESGRKVALCLLVKTRGSTPASPGAVMIVDDAAEMHGTVGGGCVEAEVRRQVFEMMGRNRTGLLQFDLDHDYGWDDGLICGGAIDVAVALPSDASTLRRVGDARRRREPAELSVEVEPEPGAERQRYVLDLPPRPHVLIAGAGHVGQAVCRLALDMDFDVTVFDDRADLLDTHIPDPARRVGGPIDETIAACPIDDGTYIVIVTRGHRHDQRVLKAVAAKPARYLGMIGSRRKVKLTFDELRADGVPDEALARVHAPIGLDIGSVTVNEIALSIVGQMIEARRTGYRSPVRGPLAPGATPT